MLKIQNQFLRNVSQVLRGTAFAQLILLAATPLLTRLFSPNAFGELVTYQSALGLGLVVSGFRYEYAILLPDDDATAKDLVAVALLASTTITAALYIVASPFLVFPADITPEISNLLLYGPPALLLGGWAQTLNFLALRKKNFRVTADSKIIRSVFLSAIALIGGLIRASGSTLMLADICGRLAALCLLWTRLSRDLVRHFRNLRLSHLSAAAKKYRRFPMVSLPSSVINTAAFNIAPLIIAANFGIAVAGFYALVDRVFRAPSALIGTAVGQVYMTELAELRRESPEKVVRLFRKVIWTQAKLAVLPAIIIPFFAPELFSWVFGQEWYESGIYLQYLAVLYFMAFIFTPIGTTLTILERQGWQLGWDSCRLAVIVLAWTIAVRLDLSPELSLLVYSLTMSAFIAIYLVLCTVAFRRLNDSQ